MPLDTPHPDYVHMIERWRRCRYAGEGEHAIKAQQKLYLPIPTGMLQDDYTGYLGRAKWYGATNRTVQGLQGAILRKDPTVDIPTVMEPHLDDITLTGVPFLSFLGLLLEELLLMGRVGVLLDFTAAPDMPRPLWSCWQAEQITFWRVGMHQGMPMLDLVILQEDAYVPQDNDPYTLEKRCRYRLHVLDENGVYQIAVYEKGGQGFYLIDEPVVPLRRGEPLRFIPFQFFAPTQLSPAIVPPPLEPLIVLNYANYRHSADYEHGLHLTALPTAVITGYRDDNVTLAIGSQAVWQIPNPDARVSFLEFQGAGLSSHVAAMQTDKEEMAILGARLLESTPDVQETLGAVRLRQLGEQGALASWARVAAQGVTQLLQYHAWWMGATENLNDPAITFGLNTDYLAQPLPAQEMIALMQVWQGGGMSLDTFLWNLQQGERLPPGRDVEQEKAMIETQQPAMVPMDVPEESLQVA